MTRFQLPRAALLATMLCLAVLFAPAGHALEQKGTADIEYGRSLDRKERAEAVRAALRKAVETWVAEKQQSQYRNYEKVKAEIDDSIEDYVLSHTVISEDQDKSARRYRVVVRASLNEPKLLATLLGPSGTATAGEDAFLTFMFVAREQIGTTSGSEKIETEEKARRQAVERERNDNTAAQTKTQTTSTTVRNNDRTLRERALWDVTTSNEIDAAMGEVFADADYLVIDASLVGSASDYTLNTDDFMADYSAGNDITAPTKRKAYSGLAGLKGTDDEIHYFAIGTLDVEASAIDEKTGNHRVAVAVTGEVWSIRRRGATVAEVGPITMAGEGSTELVARNNALRAAARRAASDLVAQLSGKNIR